ncbi:hypothetical protein K502DRAFT_326681 [Neoconidiobolus thromboides FSU 785]|nr:hypothetical protein K502DRAFT_326681 [Neoconidiobolus thromboides FSU 785]
MFNFYANNLLMIICMVYLLTIVILVVFKLRKQTGIVKNFRLFRGSRSSIEATKSVKLMGFRILLYPSIMIFTHLGLVLTKSIYDFTGKISPGADTFAYISGGMLGILNFTAFCCDPTIHSAFRKIYLRLSTRNKFRDPTDINMKSKFFSVNIDLDNFASSDSSAALTPEEAFDKKLEAFLRTL